MKFKQFIHDVFEFSISIKLINGILQILGSIALFFVSLRRVVDFVQWIFQHEISEDPNDWISSIIVGFSNHLSVKTKIFAALYLLVHGIVNIFLFASLSSKKSWAYPVAGFILIIGVLYEIARVMKTHSLILAFLIVVDLAILALMRLEYERTLKMRGKK